MSELLLGWFYQLCLEKQILVLLIFVINVKTNNLPIKHVNTACACQFFCAECNQPNKQSRPKCADGDFHSTEQTQKITTTMPCNKSDTWALGTKIIMQNAPTIEKNMQTVHNGPYPPTKHPCTTRARDLWALPPRRRSRALGGKLPHYPNQDTGTLRTFIGQIYSQSVRTLGRAAHTDSGTSTEAFDFWGDMSGIPSSIMGVNVWGVGARGAAGICMQMGLVAASKSFWGQNISLCGTGACRGPQSTHNMGTKRRGWELTLISGCICWAVEWVGVGTVGIVLELDLDDFGILVEGRGTASDRSAANIAHWRAQMQCQVGFNHGIKLHDRESVTFTQLPQWGNKHKIIGNSAIQLKPCLWFSENGVALSMWD